MDPESKKLLEETYELAKENNKMLRKVRGVQKRAFVFNVLYWFLIIGVSVGAFYFIQPYIKSFQELTKDTQSSIQGIKNILK